MYKFKFTYLFTSVLTCFGVSISPSSEAVYNFCSGLSRWYGVSARAFIGLPQTLSQWFGQTQDDKKISVHLMITVQNTRKNILNSFNQLP
jgi:hypothetical protein